MAILEYIIFANGQNGQKYGQNLWSKTIKPNL